MIKNIPIIYPNELFYSYLCRLYVRSGIGSYNEFSKLVFDGGVASPKTTFINKLRYDFNFKFNYRKLICISILL